MRRTLLISVAALALAAGSTTAMSQGSPAAGPADGAGAMKGSPSGAAGGASGGAAINANPSGGGASGAATTHESAGGAAANDNQSAELPAGTRPASRTGQAEKGKQGTQQGQAEHREGPRQGANERNEGNRQGANERNEGSKQGANERQQGGNKQGAAERPMTSKNVSLTTEQKTTIRKTVLTGSAPRVSGHVDFDIRVGVAVPRTVRFAAVPATLITIEPEWRGYDYFVYADQIIIVNPRTLEIVAVLDV